MKILRLFGLVLIFGLMIVKIQAEIFVAPKADLTVAADGSGDVKTVNEAINKVPANNKKRFVIAIKKGVYNEQVRIPADKPFVSLVGESAENTKLTFNISNKVAGSTSAAYAFYVAGHDFYAENITFENSFGQGSQAVAVLTEGDRLVFKNCRFLGWQDTLYAKNGRQYFENCYIEGHVDFIFGQAAAVFDNCTIHSKGDGYITAPMRFAADETSGYVFLNSKLTGENTDKGVFLGRPWRAFGRTVYLNTEMGAHIRPEGWNNWGKAENEKTAYFAEYNSKGAGAKMSERVKWIHQLSVEEAGKFAPENFLKGKDSWNPKTATGKWQETTKPDYKPVSWNDATKQPPLWYQTDEAARIADQVVLYQKDSGGWGKNIDMAAILTQADKDALVKSKSGGETTIDNGATYRQIEYLAQVITASLLKTSPPSNFPKYKEAFNRGLDFLFAAQYENGGYPQFFPLRKGYYTHITFNDNAMINVLKLMREIAKKKEDYTFVDEERRVKAEKAVEKALPLILKTQIEVNGAKTVWAAQYNENTLQPAPARKFEPISLTAGESVGIVRFLMYDSKPNQATIDAVEAAINWYRANKIEGIRWDRKNGENLVVKDKNAAPIWGRFYELKMMKPIFIGRDAVIHYDVMEIEAERRNGYAWYVSEPNELLEKDYPKWKAKIKKN
ncbi:MAG: rhamnogalacturonan acetylesterase [uncultured Pyrinomonadaceae bacterium]|uniref:Rhamnogalacturonan acetylesterase n=1 Tax=uncultured Pyrinomonadaceae bacterium TaxID=2283094 RepID=A0A6J4NQF7_9BACT|nr:MAG: rhamnogalacturonan acetylesterase [uncultured Pyrinomonadaceae bacterium]